MALTTEGFVKKSAEPYVFAEGADSGVLVVRLLTLYNPNATASTFIVRKVIDLFQTEGSTEKEAFYTRFDDEVPATDTWSFGTTGTPIMLVLPGQRYEIVLDADATLGIHCVCDLGRA